MKIPTINLIDKISISNIIIEQPRNIQYIAENRARFKHISKLILVGRCKFPRQQKYRIGRSYTEIWKVCSNSSSTTHSDPFATRYSRIVNALK